ncbi:hypothetical protein LguiA_030252 [Lonicera macranthoides]
MKNENEKRGRDTASYCYAVFKKKDTILKNKIKISNNYLKKKEGGVFFLLSLYFHSTFIDDIIYILNLYY